MRVGKLAGNCRLLRESNVGSCFICNKYKRILEISITDAVIYQFIVARHAPDAGRALYSSLQT